MAEDQYKPEDEYNFGESDTSGAYGGGSSKQIIGPGSTTTRRYVLLGIGLIVVVLAVYKLLGVFFTSKTVKKLTPTPTAVVQPIKQIPVTTTPTPPAQSSSTLNQKLQQLEAHSADSKTALGELNTSLQSLQNSISGLNSRITDMNYTLSNLAQEVEKQKSQLEALKTPKKAPKKRVYRRSKPVKRVVYYVKAIIPGRAWLRAANGATLTVSEGSQIPGYGRVKIIDPHRGMISTSSGRSIKFQSSDS